MTNTVRPETIAVRAGIQSDDQHGAVVPPIHLSANYSFAGLGRPRAYDYSRSGNPTRTNQLIPYKCHFHYSNTMH
jgi:cystathionine gamma-synthase